MERKIIDQILKIKWECKLCGCDTKTVNHHISYIPERILIVCPSCHFMIHMDPTFSDLVPQITRKEWLIIKRVLYPAKLDKEKLNGGDYQYITSRLDLYKDPVLLKKEGKSLTDEEMKKLIEEKPIL